MQTATEVALMRVPGGIFTRDQAACWLAAGGARLDGLLKRAVAAGEIHHLRRGLFCLAQPFLGSRPDSFALAQRIYGPSYISLEAALAHHGWIPEAVQAVTSASLPRSRDFNTPLGTFAFVRIPQTTFFAGVERDTLPGGESFLVASPLKALADYVYFHRCDWESAEPVIKSLRVEPENLEAVPRRDFDELAGVHRSARVRRFLDGLRRDLKK